MILDDLNLYVKENEFLTLLGPSGCGKTTTLRLIGGFETPDTGRIIFDGKDITSLPPNERKLNTVFQKYALFTHMSIADNIAFGLKISKKSKAYIQDKIKYALKLVNLDGYENRSIDSLSGGQQQRIAIARAIVNEPKVLLLDEPLGALDLKMRKEMQLELKNMHDQLGITFIYVTHDQEEALTMATKVCVMKEAKIQQIDTPEMIYDCPVNTFVANFIGESTVIPATIRGIREGKITAVFDKDDRLFEVDCKRRDYWAGLNKKVNFIIRPEKVKIVKEDYDGIKFPARITSCAFLGDTFRVNVITDSGIEFKMKVFSRGHYDLSVGNRLWVGVRPYDMVLVRYDDEI